MFSNLILCAGDKHAILPVSSLNKEAGYMWLGKRKDKEEKERKDLNIHSLTMAINCIYIKSLRSLFFYTHL